MQLIIYPSFKFHSPEKLKNWHQVYTKRISIIVIPLMFGQLITSGILIIQDATSTNILKMLMIVLVWALTFSIFVPLHKQIANAEDTAMIARKLVKKNWSRTLVWTIIFVLGLMDFFKPYQS